MNKKIKTTLWVLIIPFIGLALFSISLRGGKDVATGVTVEGIRKIQPGMTYKEVIEIIGEPFEIEKNPPMQIGCKEGDIKFTNSSLTYEYSRPVHFYYFYPVLWIHFDPQGKVYSIYAKRYIGWGMDDFAVYAKSKLSDEPFYFEHELFEETFK